MIAQPTVAKTIWPPPPRYRLRHRVVPPEAPATTLSFWICPATLGFDPAWDLVTDIDLRGWSFQLSLNAI
jgi:hypothetical protein